MYEGTKYPRSVWQTITTMVPDYMLDKDQFMSWHGGPQRLGQAFFNALSSPFSNMISGTAVDPFYHDDFEKVTQATAWLLQRDGTRW